MSAEILTVAQGSALAAAIEAGDLAEQDHHAQHRALALELEQATYHATLAARRYDAIDPDNRLVAAELEARWNAALERVTALEGRLKTQASAAPRSVPVVDRGARIAGHGSPQGLGCAEQRDAGEAADRAVADPRDHRQYR